MQRRFLIIKENKFFVSGLVLLICFAVFVCLFLSKEQGFYLLNPYHTKFLDQVFAFVTILGDGFFCMGVGILFLLFKKRFLSIGIFSAYLLSGLIAQVLKYFIIEARPAIFLKNSHYQYFITDVTLHNYHSFPSGHTTSAFALATFLALSFNNKILGLSLLLLAAAVGYSRMYLGQHFLIDVLSGSLIGVMSAVICRSILVKKMPAKYF